MTSCTTAAAWWCSMTSVGVMVRGKLAANQARALRPGAMTAAVRMADRMVAASRAAGKVGTAVIQDTVILVTAREGTVTTAALQATATARQGQGMAGRTE